MVGNGAVQAKAALLQVGCSKSQVNPHPPPAPHSVSRVTIPSTFHVPRVLVSSLLVSRLPSPFAFLAIYIHTYMSVTHHTNPVNNLPLFSFPQTQLTNPSLFFHLFYLENGNNGSLPSYNSLSICWCSCCWAI